MTGPTGSGKTTSLYAATGELNTPDRKIITAEDPVEYYLPGINQVEIKHSIGLDFARVIRAMLRPGPERDSSGRNARPGDGTDGNPGQSYWTLGISTLHTNDALVLCRLIDMECPRTWSPAAKDHGPTVVRVICRKCRAVHPSEAALRT